MKFRDMVQVTFKKHTPRKRRRFVTAIIRYYLTEAQEIVDQAVWESVTNSRGFICTTWRD